MGLADFGVTGVGNGAQAYEYSTSTFQSSALVHAINISIPAHAPVSAFELNAVVVLQRGGVNYTYWIQNGLHLDSSSDLFTIGGAYVWNFSSSTARLSASELQGNSSSVLISDTYYFIPTCGTFPAQCSALSLPAGLNARVFSATSGGIPYVAYEYNVGGGWVTYDNVSFLHMAGAADLGFVVDGFVPTPIGASLFYDAEWIWGAAGGGSSGVDQKSDIAMSLRFWNGHNFQSIPNAWDFGGNTGETTSNVSVAREYAPAGGAVSAHLTNGSGTLGPLYNTSQVGFLHVAVPALGPQTLLVDGVPTDFAGGWANLTVATGTHSVSLENYSNASQQVSIGPGLTTSVNFSQAGRLLFEESGLPNGTTWGVALNGSLSSTASTTIAFNVPNGTYAISYASVPGFVRNASVPGNVTVPATTPILVDWSPFAFPVRVDETGLPTSTPWWVNASGIILRGTGTTLEVSAPNGSTPFEVGAGYGFVASPSHGAIDVTGGVYAPVEVQFSVRLAYVTGTVTPRDAQVSLDGASLALSDGSFNDSVNPGTYTLVASAAGFTTKTLQIDATPGNETGDLISLVASASPNSTGPAPSAGPSIPTEDLIAAGVAVAAVVVAAAVIVFRRRSKSR